MFYVPGVIDALKYVKVYGSEIFKHDDRRFYLQDYHLINENHPKAVRDFMDDRRESLLFISMVISRQLEYPPLHRSPWCQIVHPRNNH